MLLAKGWKERVKYDKVGHREGEREVKLYVTFQNIYIMKFPINVDFKTHMYADSKTFSKDNSRKS